MLGNLSVNEVERRLGIPFPDDIKDFLKKNHQASADSIKK